MTEDTEQGEGIDARQEATPTEAVGDALMRADLKSRMFGVTGSVRVGRFDVLRKLGEGGMGVVYAARDPELDRAIALKLLHGSAQDSLGLAREAKALAQLSHPNVVAIHDVGQVNGRMYIAMEFVEGETLRRWAESARPWAEVVRAFAQAGAGLQAAHDAGIVHRDFKPDNAIRGRDGRVRVLDFGLARAAGVTEPGSSESTRALPQGLTATGHVRGTPAYMAPEQASGGAADARCDQYSFCVALYEALAGHRPFRGESLVALARAQATGALRAPPNDTEVPAAVWSVLRRGLSTTPDDRFSSMRALLEAVDTAASPARPTRFGKPARLLGLAGVAVMGVGMVSYATFSADATRPASVKAPEVAEPEPEVAAPPAADELPSDLAPPAECPPFRAPGLEPKQRTGRLAFLHKMLAPMDDGDPRLPETLLWQSEFSLQAGDVQAACASLGRLADLELDGEVAEAAPCWRRAFCTPAQVECPPGFAADAVDGCRPEVACEIDLDDEAALAEARLACDRGDTVCCAMDVKLAILDAVVAARGDDTARQDEAVAHQMVTLQLACELGHAALCAYAADLLTDDKPLPVDDPARAAPLRARACALGHTASCG